MSEKWFNEGGMGDEKNYVINYLHGENKFLIKRCLQEN